jgi:hypothetical protein
MTASNRRRDLSFLLPILIVLGVAGYRYARSSPLDGTWLKTDGVGYLANEMRLQLTRNEFTVRFRRDETMGLAGVEHITFLLDGREHLFEAQPGGARMIYRAELDGRKVVVIKHVAPPPETWDLSWRVGKLLRAAANSWYQHKGRKPSSGEYRF